MKPHKAVAGSRPDGPEPSHFSGVQGPYVGASVNADLASAAGRPPDSIGLGAAGAASVKALPAEYRLAIQQSSAHGTHQHQQSSRQSPQSGRASMLMLRVELRPIAQARRDGKMVRTRHPARSNVQCMQAKAGMAASQMAWLQRGDAGVRPRLPRRARTGRSQAIRCSSSRLIKRSPTCIQAMPSRPIFNTRRSPPTFCMCSRRVWNTTRKTTRCAADTRTILTYVVTQGGPTPNSSVSAISYGGAIRILRRR